MIVSSILGNFQQLVLEKGVKASLSSCVTAELKDSSSSSSCVTDDGKSKRIMSTSKASGGGVTIQYPMLEGDNYGVWAAKMKVFMRARGVWAAVEGDGAVEEIKDQEAFAAIPKLCLMPFS